MGLGSAGVLALLVAEVGLRLVWPQALYAFERGTFVSHDDYGYCLSCGETINENRLRVDPTATLCIDCANRAESSS